MKTRFIAIDVFAAVADAQPLIGMRVQNVYDCDAKTYLIKLAKPEHKSILLFESSARMHTTEYDWPKPSHPSSFTMKLRKHIKSKLGIDRIVDLQFGTDTYACHVIVEMYDRGNVLLTDHEYNILNLLRWRTEKDTDVKFGVGQIYPIASARANLDAVSRSALVSAIDAAKPTDNLRKLLATLVQCGSPLLEHSAMKAGVNINASINQIRTSINEDGEEVDKIYGVIEEAYKLFDEMKNATSTEGFVTYRVQQKTAVTSSAVDAEDNTFEEYVDFHCMLFDQVAAKSEQTPVKRYDSFSKAVDDFFSSRETQKMEVKAKQQEKSAMKKLENVEKDHETRLKNLHDTQEVCQQKAALIEANTELVEKALKFLRTALAQGITWKEIEQLVDASAKQGQELGQRIVKLNLKHGGFTLSLDDKYGVLGDVPDDAPPKRLPCELQISLNAHQNARAHYDQKRWAAHKEQRTVDASKKALKSAKIRTDEALKMVQVRTAVSRQRKTYWFEKFLWFISADNYLVLGGRDMQQNELLVRRYLNSGDAYVHTDVRACPSVIVKNISPTLSADEIPPRTLHAAATMAVCYSAAWEAKVLTGAWWVKHDQVSRTAPTGEYLTTGSFMIRGKKNFLPPVQLVMGFGYVFRLAEEFIDENKRRIVGDRDNAREARERRESILEAEEEEEDKEEVEIEISDEEEEGEFPDVTAAVRMDRLTTDDAVAEAKGDFTIVQVGPRHTQQEMRLQARDRKKAAEEDKKKKGKQPLPDVVAQAAPLQAQKKRGQKYKNRKMKLKYDDQDEEERTMRMTLIHHGNKAYDKDGVIIPIVGKGEECTDGDGKGDTDSEEEEVETVVEKTRVTVEEEVKVEHDDEEEEEEKDGGDDAHNILYSLTQSPTEEQVLMFAIPVCAPYACMHDYKYKVKLTPGTGKKGKATKTAVQIFLKNTRATEREKDLLKATQQLDLGHNVPGKVKVQAPSLLKVKAQQQLTAKQSHKTGH